MQIFKSEGNIKKTFRKLEKRRKYERNKECRKSQERKMHNSSQKQEEPRQIQWIENRQTTHKTQDTEETQETESTGKGEDVEITTDTIYPKNKERTEATGVAGPTMTLSYNRSYTSIRKYWRQRTHRYRR